ncbi:Uncharacterized protein FWK35_00011413 [Aphis craccivora]|uniref:Uncharacterized protein n=1 Tax=Aphis craccivora TaxID=307492 RepID=A0A6G0YL91_APHCR|nr:Uncharacterized protein FWK35_00011413 [Aphis craccivora]
MRAIAYFSVCVSARAKNKKRWINNNNNNEMMMKKIIDIIFPPVDCRRCPLVRNSHRNASVAGRAPAGVWVHSSGTRHRSGESSGGGVC